MKQGNIVMFKRSDLQDFRTPGEMKALLDSVINYPNDLLKVIWEEYAPLFTLVTHLVNVESACLMPESNPGHDAEVRLIGREEKIKIQITTSDKSYNTALIEELLNQGECIPTTAAVMRDSGSGKVVKKYKSSRALRNPTQYQQEQVEYIIGAINKKVIKDFSGAMVLLVTSCIKDYRTDNPYSWREDVITRVNAIGTGNYQCIYLANRYFIDEGELILLAGSSMGNR